MGQAMITHEAKSAITKILGLFNTFFHLFCGAGADEGASMAAAKAGLLCNIASDIVQDVPKRIGDGSVCTERAQRAESEDLSQDNGLSMNIYNNCTRCYPRRVAKR